MFFNFLEERRIAGIQASLTGHPNLIEALAAFGKRAHVVTLDIAA